MISGLFQEARETGPAEQSFIDIVFLIAIDVRVGIVQDVILKCISTTCSLTLVHILARLQHALHGSSSFHSTKVMRSESRYTIGNFFISK